jgi:hypothetical protein
MRALCVPVFLLALAAPASAQAPLPVALARAIATAEAKAEPEQRWAFTRTVVGPDGKTTVDRYDPRRPPHKEWLRVSSSKPEKGSARPKDAGRAGEQEQLSASSDPNFEAPQAGIEALADRAASEDDKAERIVVTGSRKHRRRGGPEEDRLVMVEGPALANARAMLAGGLSLAEERATDGAAERRYAFDPPDHVLWTRVGDEKPRDLGWFFRHFRGEAVVTVDQPKLISIHFFAPQPFSLFKAVRISTLDVTERYCEAEPGGPVALARVETRAAAGLIFGSRKVETSVISYSDFERVNVRDDDPQTDD